MNSWLSRVICGRALPCFKASTTGFHICWEWLSGFAPTMGTSLRLWAAGIRKKAGPRLRVRPWKKRHLCGGNQFPIIFQTETMLNQEFSAASAWIRASSFCPAWRRRQFTEKATLTCISLAVFRVDGQHLTQVVKACRRLSPKNMFSNYNFSTISNSTINLSGTTRLNFRFIIINHLK